VLQDGTARNLAHSKIGANLPMPQDFKDLKSIAMIYVSGNAAGVYWT